MNWPTEELNRRINARVKQMMELGLLEEVRGLTAAGRLGPTSGEALGYKQLAEHLKGGGGQASLEAAVERIKIETRRFAKNQRTWLKRLSAMSGAVGIEALGKTPEMIAQVVVNSILT